MAQINLANLGLLPSELQCQILRGPLTLREFKNIREVSHQLEDTLFSCLEELISEGDEGSLFPDFVLDLERIRVISPEYPIFIENKAQLIDLAKHKTLQEATFNISEGLDNLIPYIKDFFSVYRTYGNTCQDCQERYNFTFYTQGEDKIHLIQVTEGSLRIYGMAERIEAAKELYQFLPTLVPICEFIGETNDSLTTLNTLPCLTKLSLRYEEFVEVFDPNESYNWFADSVMGQNIKEYYFSWPKLTARDLKLQLYTPGDFTRYFVSDFLEPNDAIFPWVTTFLPITYFGEDIKTLRKVFPNLTSIWLTRSSLPRREANHKLFLGLREIVIVNDLLDPLDKEKILDLFTPEQRKIVIFTESDWLY